MNGTARRATIIVGVGSLAVWITLALIIRTSYAGTPTGLDTAVLDVMVHHRMGTLTAAMIAITTFGGTVAMTAATVGAAALLVWRRDWWATGLVVAAGVSAAAFVPLTKNLLLPGAQPVLDTGEVGDHGVGIGVGVAVVVVAVVSTVVGDVDEQP
jgi:hypothetical protein